jgi:hypothetical protein
LIAAIFKNSGWDAFGQVPCLSDFLANKGGVFLVQNKERTTLKFFFPVATLML